MSVIYEPVPSRDVLPAVEAFRQLGRTTRMLRAAQAITQQGRHVVILSVGGEYMRRLMRFPGFDPATMQMLDGRKCEFDEHGPTQDSLLQLGCDENTVVLIDHYLLETKYARMLAVLHAFDTDDGLWPLPRHLRCPAAARYGVPFDAAVEMRNRDTTDSGVR